MKLDGISFSTDNCCLCVFSWHCRPVEGNLIIEQTRSCNIPLTWSCPVRVPSAGTQNTYAMKKGVENGSVGRGWWVLNLEGGGLGKVWGKLEVTLVNFNDIGTEIILFICSISCIKWIQPLKWHLSPMVTPNPPPKNPNNHHHTTLSPYSHLPRKFLIDGNAKRIRREMFGAV